MIGSALIARIVPYAIVIQTKTKCFFATSVTGISYFRNVKTMISILYYYDSILFVLSTIFFMLQRISQLLRWPRRNP